MGRKPPAGSRAGVKTAARKRTTAAKGGAAARARQLDVIFAAIRDAVIVCDAEGRILETNAAADELLAQFVPAESHGLPIVARGLSVGGLRDCDGAPLAEEHWPQVRMLRGEALRDAEAMDVLCRRRDGGDTLLNVSGGPIYDGDGHITGIVCVYRDVTERRRLEQQAHAALEALLEMAEAMVAPRAASEDRVLATAQRLVELTCRVLGCQRVLISLVEAETELLRPLAAAGLTPEQTILWQRSGARAGRRFDAGMDAETAARLRAGEVRVFDLRDPGYQHVTNRYGLTLLLVAPLRVGEQLVGLLLADYGGEEHTYTADEQALAGTVARLAALVIERERLQDEREAARADELALRQTAKRMEDFLRTVNHELKTPMTVVKVHLQLLRRRLDALAEVATPEPEQVLRVFDDSRENIRRAAAQTQRLTRLVGDLTSGGQNDLDLQPAPCDLGEIVRAAHEEACVLAPAREVILCPPAAAEVPLVADADRVTQVVLNYLTNAIKYAPEDRPITLTLTLEAEMARVAVADEGPGLTPEQHERIWERGYRVPEREAHGGLGMGMGLGLPISRDIIARHGGQVGVESAPGQGATFWFTLPLTPSPS